MENCTTYLDTIIHTERHNDDIKKFHTKEIKKLFEKDKKARYWWENI